MIREALNHKALHFQIKIKLSGRRGSRVEESQKIDSLVKEWKKKLDEMK